jgi:CHASE2 domain-containing sensor protein
MRAPRAAAVFMAVTFPFLVVASVWMSVLIVQRDGWRPVVPAFFVSVVFGAFIYRAIRQG